MDISNNAPNSLGLAPKEILTGAKVDRSFKNFHTFGSPDFVLHSTMQKVQKIPTWLPRSITSVLVGKCRDHASNVSLVCNPATNHMPPQFHITRDDKFQTVPPSGSKSLPSDWREVFQTSHCGDDGYFKNPLAAKLDDKYSDATLDAVTPVSEEGL